MKQKIAFLDRDGALIYEPQDTFQVDSLDKLRVLDGVTEGLKRLIEDKFTLVMVSNQDGLGTQAFPQAAFEVPQNRLLEMLRADGIEFERIFICPHFPEDQCECRKPKTGLVDGFLKDMELDSASFMYGD